MLNSYLLCNAGDVIHTFLLLVYGESAFQINPVTASQLNTSFQLALNMHGKTNPPKIKFVPSQLIPQDKAHMYNPLDVIEIFII